MQTRSEYLLYVNVRYYGEVNAFKFSERCLEIIPIRRKYFVLEFAGNSIEY